MSDEDKDRISLLSRAKTYGNHPEMFTGDFKNYLKSKAGLAHKLIKVYKGYIFIYFRNSKRLITCYKVPEKFQNECNVLGVNVNDIYVPKNKKNNKFS